MMPLILRVGASALAIVIVAAVALVMMVAASVLAGAEETTTQPRGGAAARALREACQADTEKLCPGTQPGGGRLLQCLRGKQDQISEGCKSALASARATRR
jgi:hypothetical protein